MAIKIEQTCGRCGKSHFTAAADATAAQTLLEVDQKKEARAKEIIAFLKTIPAEELPDLFVAQKSGDEPNVIIHTHLCDGSEGRNCAPRVAEIVKSLDVLPERKPRTKKAKADAPADAPEVAEDKA